MTIITLANTGELPQPVPFWSDFKTFHEIQINPIFFVYDEYGCPSEILIAILSFELV